AGGAEADRGAGRHLRVRAPRLPPRGELGRRVRVRPGHREHRPAAARTRLPSRRGAVDGRATGRRAPRARERHPDPNRGGATALPHEPTRHTARDGLRSEAEVAMATTTGTGVYYDPYDVGINADPYPVFRRLREEAPLYRNDEHDFYALSRFDDVERGLVDRETYISGRGAVLELINAGIEMPPGVLIFEDPPVHTVHRGLLSRHCTPKKR